MNILKTNSLNKWENRYIKKSFRSNTIPEIIIPETSIINFINENKLSIDIDDKSTLEEYAYHIFRYTQITKEIYDNRIVINLDYIHNTSFNNKYFISYKHINYLKNIYLLDYYDGKHYYFNHKEFNDINTPFTYSPYSSKYCIYFVLQNYSMELFYFIEDIEH